ncbi:hypothetical protein C8R46DRAFT_294736 [Mycena filopes]|nr:hypothetical protein C8R46DRAFT_294736 [Mycena filopes]
MAIGNRGSITMMARFIASVEQPDPLYIPSRLRVAATKLYYGVRESSAVYSLSSSLYTPLGHFYITGFGPGSNIVKGGFFTGGLPFNLNFCTAFMAGLCSGYIIQVICSLTPSIRSTRIHTDNGTILSCPGRCMLN